MRILRFRNRGKARYGVLEDNQVRSLRGNPFTHLASLGELIWDGKSYDFEQVKILAPCQPSKIIALGLNYRSHAEETGMEIPKTPLIFMKPSTAVIGPDDAIVLPQLPKYRVDYEGELGVVIGKLARNVPATQARDCILGYTCVNDVSERYAQRDDGQWTRAKGFDTFAPVGPWIETAIADPDNLKLETYLNGQVKQSSNTSDLIFDIAYLVSFVSSVMTLLPGDIISTGTPSGIGRLSPGDVVEVKIEQIGILRNTVMGPG